MDGWTSLFTVRLALVASWIVAIGIFIAFPRPHTTADLPGAFSLLRKEAESRQREEAALLSKRAAALETRESYGQGRWLTVQQKLLTRGIRNATDDSASRSAVAGTRSEQRKEDAVKHLVGAAEAVSADRATAAVLLSGSARVGPTLHQLYYTVVAELRSREGTGSISPDRLRRYSALAAKALEGRDVTALEGISRGLADPEYEARLAAERLSSGAIVVIASHTDRSTTGFVVDGDRTVVVPVDIRSPALPAAVASELRRWGLARSWLLRTIWVCAAILAVILMPIERRLAAWEPEARQEPRRSAMDDFRTLKRLSRESALLRKAERGGRTAETSAAEVRPPQGVPVREHGLTAGLIATGVIALSISLCVAIGVYSNPAYPRADPSLQAVVQARIEHGGFVVADYAEAPQGPGAGMWRGAAVPDIEGNAQR